MRFSNNRMAKGKRNPYFLRLLSQHPKDCAQQLLGNLIVRRTLTGKLLVARIVEVEAYHQDEPASHSFRGKTLRNAAMFLPPGYCYVYFIYGNHYCLNVSCMEEGIGAAILIRRAEPLSPKSLRLDSPGLLCKALEVDKSLNGVDMLSSESPLFLRRGKRLNCKRIIARERIGIRVAKDLMWRFILKL